MIYIRVKWKHEDPDDPIVLYSELDDQRWEIRKIEVFRNGRKGCASAEGEIGGTALSIEPIPELDEIAKDRQFEPAAITKDEFESIWAQRGTTLP